MSIARGIGIPLTCTMLMKSVFILRSFITTYMMDSSVTGLTQNVISDVLNKISIVHIPVSVILILLLRKTTLRRTLYIIIASFTTAILLYMTQDSKLIYLGYFIHATTEGIVNGVVAELVNRYLRSQYADTKQRNYIFTLIHIASNATLIVMQSLLAFTQNRIAYSDIMLLHLIIFILLSTVAVVVTRNAQDIKEIETIKYQIAKSRYTTSRVLLIALLLLPAMLYQLVMSFEESIFMPFFKVASDSGRGYINCLAVGIINPVVITLLSDRINKAYNSIQKSAYGTVKRLMTAYIPLIAVVGTIYAVINSNYKLSACLLYYILTAVSELIIIPATNSIHSILYIPEHATVFAIATPIISSLICRTVILSTMSKVSIGTIQTERNLTDVVASINQYINSTAVIGILFITVSIIASIKMRSKVEKIAEDNRRIDLE